MLHTLERADADLISQCLNGDSEAWAVLVTRYKRLVYAIPFRLGLDTEDRNEVFQAVWLDCYKHLNSLRDPQSFEAWLIRIAVRRSYQQKQQRLHHLEVSLPMSEFEDLRDYGTSDEFADRLVKERSIQTAVGQLTGRCQQVINALFFEEPQPTYSELATRLGLSPNSIGFTRDRCLDCLGKVLKDLGLES